MMAIFKVVTDREYPRDEVGNVLRELMAAISKFFFC